MSVTTLNYKNEHELKVFCGRN